MVSPAGERSIDAPPAAIELPRSDRRLATLALMLASGMQAADATITNVALPQLEGDLGGGVIIGAWVVTGYLCATAIMAPLTGWLRRRFGARSLFTAAVVGFAVASLLCSIAPSPATIILFRVLQGAAGGVIHPLAQAILLDLYPRERHGRMLAAWGATIMVGPIVGPGLGGIITDLASWRFVFLVNQPLAAFAVWAMRRALPRMAANSDLPIDLLGVAGSVFPGSTRPSYWSRRQPSSSPSPHSSPGRNARRQPCFGRWCLPTSISPLLPFTIS
jgi:DHA2 family multidrug resistance protein